MSDAPQDALVNQRVALFTGSPLQTNLFVGAALILQLTGVALSRTKLGEGLIGPTLIVAGLPLMVAGCVSYAAGKAQSKWFGLAGLFGVLGLLVLVILPDGTRDNGARGLPLLKLLALLFMAIGFGLAAYGLYLDQPLAVSDRVDPWPAVCMLTGALLVIVSATVIVRKRAA